MFRFSMPWDRLHTNLLNEKETVHKILIFKYCYKSARKVIKMLQGIIKYLHCYVTYKNVHSKEGLTFFEFSEHLN